MSSYRQAREHLSVKPRREAGTLDLLSALAVTRITMSHFGEGSHCTEILPICCRAPMSLTRLDPTRTGHIGNFKCAACGSTVRDRVTLALPDTERNSGANFFALEGASIPETPFVAPLTSTAEITHPVEIDRWVS